MRIIIAVMLAIGLAGCSVAALKPSGAGNTVYSTDIATESRLQEVYSGILCRDNGLPFSSDGEHGPRCNYAAMSGPQWTVFVNAGVYDIDRRCDDYLDWLYQIKRSRGPIQKQMTRTANLTKAVLELTGTADFTIELVGLAFGYALDSWTDVADSLLFNMEYSTVQKLVYDRQRLMKEDIFKISFTSRPQALHALRGYLRVCMPYTIETDINTTLVAGTVTGLMSTGVAEVSAASVGAKTATDRVEYIPAPPATDEAKKLFLPSAGRYDSDVVAFQKLACEATTDGKVGPKTLAAVAVLEEIEGRGFVADGKLDSREYDYVLTFNSPCPVSLYKNIFERALLSRPADARLLIEAMNVASPTNPLPIDIDYGAAEFPRDTFRAKLTELRALNMVTINATIPNDWLTPRLMGAIYEKAGYQ